MFSLRRRLLTFCSASLFNKCSKEPKVFVKPYQFSSFRLINKLSSHYYIVSQSLKTMPALEGLHFSWDLNLTSEDLLANTDAIISASKQRYDSVGSVKSDNVNFETVLKVLADAETHFKTAKYYYEFIQFVSTDKALRDASCEAQKRLEDFVVETEMRQDIFRHLLTLEAKKLNLPFDAKRYLERLIRTGKRNGLHLSAEEQEEIKRLKQAISDKCIRYSKNLTEVNTILEFTDDELIGLPEDFISNLPKCADSGKRKVTLKYPHYFPIMQKAKNPETRRQMEFAFNTQCMEENTVLLEEVAALRHKLANVLGFPTFVDYAAEINMAKSAKNISKFITDLVEKLAPLWKDERKYMLELKENECEEMKIPFDGKLNIWDLSYYRTKVEELKYAVDENKLREYFPLPVVIKGIFEIYQKLLGLTFKEIENPPVWHPDVQVFSVTDSESGQFMGYFFLDLFPREGKYSHAANFDMQRGCLLCDGTRQAVAVGVLTNFTKPTSEKPSLLSHNEVTTFFHEFGHTMHYICCQVDYIHFSPFEVERDFIEAPSQMLENWCWLPAPLKMMSSHYVDQSPMPDDMMDALIKSELANSGYKNLRQACLATFDQRIHTCDKADIKAVFREINWELMGLVPTEGTSFGANFNHMANGYEGQYYGYLWSEVFSKDMFETHFGKVNVLNPVVGKEYRAKILLPGATKDAMDMIKDFLGREPTQDAFLISKGLKV